jgi:hypothetical protein
LLYRNYSHAPVALDDRRTVLLFCDPRFERFRFLRNSLSPSEESDSREARSLDSFFDADDASDSAQDALEEDSWALSPSEMPEEADMSRWGGGGGRGWGGG